MKGVSPLQPPHLRTGGRAGGAGGWPRGAAPQPPAPRLPLFWQLPGVESCQNYLFRYGRHPLMELPLMINPTGCARAEPKILTHYKR